MRLTGYETTALVDCVQTWRYSVDARQYGFFLAKKIRPTRSQTLKELDVNPNSSETPKEDHPRPSTPGTPDHVLGYVWEVGSLANYEAGFFNRIDPSDRFVCFADPSTYEAYPGWMLRNLLVLVRRRFKIDDVQVLCYRDVQTRRDEARSIILNLEVDKTHLTSSNEKESAFKSPEMPRVTGWERNGAGKVTSKVANLGEYMDPQRYVFNYASVICINYSRLSSAWLTKLST